VAYQVVATSVASLSPTTAHKSMVRSCHGCLHHDSSGQEQHRAAVFVVREWLVHSPERPGLARVALDLCEEKLSDGPASARTGLPTAAIVSGRGAWLTGFGGTAGDCCLFLSWPMVGLLNRLGSMPPRLLSRPAIGSPLPRPAAMMI